jgi:hypothetical protein
VFSNGANKGCTFMFSMSMRISHAEKVNYDRIGLILIPKEKEKETSSPKSNCLILKNIAQPEAITVNDN